MYNKNIILIICIIILIFNNKFFDFGKSLISLIIIFYIINYLNPVVAQYIKVVIIDFITLSLDTNFINECYNNLNINGFDFNLFYDILNNYKDNKFNKNSNENNENNINKENKSIQLNNRNVNNNINIKYNKKNS